MIPYWDLAVVRLGPVGVSVHLLAVMGGLAVAYALFVRETGRVGLPRARADEFAFYVIVPGLVAAHVGFLAMSGGGLDWFQRLNPVAGALTLPGMLVAGLMVEWRMRVWGIGRVERLAWWDAGARVFPWAWLVVRAGCFLSHDSPGVKTMFPLAVRYPDGQRYDLALLEMLWAAALIVFPSRRPMWRMSVSYGVVRLGVHWLRVERHGVDLVLSGLVLLIGLFWEARFGAGRGSVVD